MQVYTVLCRYVPVNTVEGGEKSYQKACKDAGLNNVKEQLDESDKLHVFRVMNKYNKFEKKTNWTLEKARQGAGRIRWKEKEIRRSLLGSLARQQNDPRKRKITSWSQKQWNELKETL